jgi:hypothetical protein
MDELTKSLYEELVASGLTHEQAIQQIIGGAGRPRAPSDDDRSRLGEFGAGAALGASQALTSLGEGLGIAGEMLLPESMEAPATALKESSQELERKAEDFFDPQGGAGAAGRLVGRIAGEVATTVGTLGAGRALAPTSAVNAFRSWAGGSRVKSGLAAASAELPLSVPRAFSYAEETGRPFSRELAIEIAGGGIGGALFPGAKAASRGAGRYGLGDKIVSGERALKESDRTGLLDWPQKKRFQLFDEFVPLMATLKKLGREADARLLNGKLSQMQGSQRAAMNYAQTYYKQWFRQSGKDIDAIGQAASIRTDNELRKQALYELDVSAGLGQNNQPRPSLRQRLVNIQADPNASKKQIKELQDRIARKEKFVERGKLDISESELAKKLKQVEDDPSMMQKTDELRKFFSELLQMRVRAGILPQSEFDKIVNKRGYYSPFVEDFSEMVSDEASEFVGRTPRFKPQKGVDPITTTKTGEGKLYQDPTERLIVDTFNTFNDIAKYNVGETFSRSVREAGGQLLDDSGNVIIKSVDEEVWTGLASSKKWRHKQPDGTWDYYEIGDGDLFHALTQEGEEVQSTMRKILTKAADFKRKSITIVPDFSVAAIVRDWPIYAAQRAGQRGASAIMESALGAGAGAAVGAGMSEEDDRLMGALTGAGMGAGLGVLARPAVEIGGALTAITRGETAKRLSGASENFINNTSKTSSEILGTIGEEFGVTDPRIWNEFVNVGGVTAGLSYGSKDAYKFIASMPKGERDTIVGFLGKGASGVHDLLEFIGMAAENAPRVAMYRQLRKSGVDIPESVWQAQDVTLPFARRGAMKGLKTVSQITPFFNATLKGWDKTFRLFRGDPEKNAVPAVAQSMLALGTAITAPTLALWNINKDNSEYWDRPLWERNLFWLVPKAEGGFWRVPKPFELGYIFASIPERALDAAAKSGAIESASEEGSDVVGDVSSTIKDFAKNAVTGTVPIPAGLQPFVEMATNRDLFRWRAIEPEYLKTRPAGERYTVRTPILARSIADVINQAPGPDISPLKIEAMLNSFGGATARRAMQAVDVVGANSDRLTPASRKTTEERIADVMGLARFNTQSYDIGEIEYQAYNMLKRSSDFTAQYNRMQRSGVSRFLVQEYKKEYEDELRIARSLKSLYGQMRNLRTQRNEILNNERLSDESRRRQLDRLKERGRTLGARAFQRIDRVTS